MCAVTLVLCGGGGLPPPACTWAPLWVLHPPQGPAPPPIARAPSAHSLLIPSGRWGPERTRGNQSLCLGFAAPIVPRSSQGPPSRPPPRSPCYVPTSSVSAASPFLPRSRRLGKVSFPFLPGEPVATILSPLLGRLVPAELGESASSPAAPLASFCKPRPALQGEKWEDSR